MGTSTYNRTNVPITYYKHREDCSKQYLEKAVAPK